MYKILFKTWFKAKTINGDVEDFIRQLLEKSRDEGYECGLSAGKVFVEQAREKIRQDFKKEIIEKIKFINNH